MFNYVISRFARNTEASGEVRSMSRLARVKAAYADWRDAQDIGAIMSALDRLSDKRLAMIGLSREHLYEAVTDMMDEVHRQRRIGEEVLELLDAPTPPRENGRDAEPGADPAPVAINAEDRAAA